MLETNADFVVSYTAGCLGGISPELIQTQTSVRST